MYDIFWLGSVTASPVQITTVQKMSQLTT